MSLQSLGHAISARLLPAALAILAAAVLGAIVQTQFNLAAIQALGAPVSLGTRLQATAHDLFGFMPLFAVVVGAALLCALPVALGLARLIGFGRLPLAVAGAVAGLAVAFAAANAATPLPTVIAAARTTAGYWAMLATAAAGALVYLALRRRPYAGPAVLRRGWLPPMLTAGLVAGLVAMLLAAGDKEPTPPEQATLRPYVVETVADGLVHPWGLAFLPDGRMLVTERPGRLRIISADGALHSEPVANVPEVLAAGQGGLLDVQVSPDFARDGWVYLSHACGTPEANNTCITRGRLEGHALVERERIFQATPMRATGAHYGSRLAFLPDGTLLATVGDGFEYREQAQNPGNHLGSIVRLRPDGGVPADNPYAERDAFQPALYTLGHRNPQGLVVDPASGVVYAHEHGPRGGDEINRIEAGANYGWPLAVHGVNYTGELVSPHAELPGYQAPLHYWRPSIAPSGMALYRGAMFPELQGGLLVAALAARSLRWLALEGGRVANEFRLFPEIDRRLRDVRVGPEGALYLLTDHDPGQVLRIRAKE